jgi:hypothetical protein
MDPLRPWLVLEPRPKSPQIICFETPYFESPKCQVPQWRATEA